MDVTQAAGKASKPESALEPLKVSIFRWLWIANTSSNIGTWIQDVGGAWYMMTLTDSTLFIALMQSATSFPLFLLALPAGVASDLVDRRRMLIFTTSLIVISAVILATLVFFGLISPILLLLLTVILNLGAAFFVPVWQASIPEMVPRDQLSGAIALNSASINVARAVGPAVGGFLLAAVGAWATYSLNAVITTFLVVLLLRWKRPPVKSKLPPEKFFAATRVGLRYLRNSSALKALLVRTAAFIIPGSAVFALLPIVVKQDLGFGASVYGVLLGFVGVGALLGVYFLPGLRAKFSANRISIIASVLLTITLLGLAAIGNIVILSALMLIGGLGWLLTLSSFHVATMTSVPVWVRGRAVSAYLMVFYGGMSAGAAIWGLLSSSYGASIALVAAAATLFMGIALAFRFKLPQVDKEDLEPMGRWGEPVVVREFNSNDQTVMVTVEYKVDPRQEVPFKAAMNELKDLRKRDGAFSWQLGEDVADPSRYIEVFFLESWVEHLHQHERGTKVDQVIEDRAKGFHEGGEAPKVSHLLVSS